MLALHHLFSPTGECSVPSSFVKAEFVVLHRRALSDYQMLPSGRQSKSLCVVHTDELEDWDHVYFDQQS